MKKSYLFISMVFVFTSHTLLAQNVARPGYAINANDTVVQEGRITNAPHPARVPVRAARDFGKRFPGRSAAWHQSNDTVVARFTAEGVTTFAGYGKSGKWLYTVRCFCEWQIPPTSRNKVKSVYSDCQINIIYELAYSQNTTIVYYLYLTDMKGKQKIIRWSEKGIELVKPQKKMYFHKYLSAFRLIKC